MITVADLIKALQQAPQDGEVVWADDADDHDLPNIVAGLAIVVGNKQVGHILFRDPDEVDQAKYLPAK